VRIPRCRATVSEEIAAGHWGSPGRPVVFIGRPESRAELGRAGETPAPTWTGKIDSPHFVLTRKPGDRREPSTPTPFA
jgi:hypothetical protein